MSNDHAYPSFPTPSLPRPRVNRTAVILLVVVSSMLLALGVVGWWLLAGIDARYNQVAAETASSLNELHEVGLHTFAVYGNIMEMHGARDPAVRVALLQTIATERAANDRLFEKLQAALTDPALRNQLNEVLAKRKSCRQEADEFLAEKQPAAGAAAGNDRSLSLLHAYLAYQQACDKLTDGIETTARQTSRELTEDVKTLRWLFFGVGVLPIVVAVLFLVVSLGLLQVVKIDGQEE